MVNKTATIQGKTSASVIVVLSSDSEGETDEAEDEEALVAPKVVEKIVEQTMEVVADCAIEPVKERSGSSKRSREKTIDDDDDGPTSDSVKRPKCDICSCSTNASKPVIFHDSIINYFRLGLNFSLVFSCRKRSKTKQRKQKLKQVKWPFSVICWLHQAILRRTQL